LELDTTKKQTTAGLDLVQLALASGLTFPIGHIGLSVFNDVQYCILVLLAQGTDYTHTVDPS